MQTVDPSGALEGSQGKSLREFDENEYPTMPANVTTQVETCRKAKVVAFQKRETAPVKSPETSATESTKVKENSNAKFKSLCGQSEHQKVQKSSVEDMYLPSEDSSKITEASKAKVSYLKFQQLTPIQSSLPISPATNLVGKFLKPFRSMDGAVEPGNATMSQPVLHNEDSSKAIAKAPGILEQGLNGEIEPKSPGQGIHVLPAPHDLGWAEGDLLSQPKLNRVRANSDPLPDSLLRSEVDQDEYTSASYDQTNTRDWNASSVVHGVGSSLPSYRSEQERVGAGPNFSFPILNQHVHTHHAINMSNQLHIQSHEQQMVNSFYIPGNDYLATTSSNPIPNPENAQYMHMARLDKYRCTFCDVVFVPSNEFPAYFCPFCTPKSNVCYW